MENPTILTYTPEVAEKKNLVFFFKGGQVKQSISKLFSVGTFLGIIVCR